MSWTFKRHRFSKEWNLFRVIRMPRCCKLLFHFGRNVISRVSDQRIYIYIRVCACLNCACSTRTTRLWNFANVCLPCRIYSSLKNEIFVRNFRSCLGARILWKKEKLYDEIIGYSWDISRGIIHFVPFFLKIGDEIVWKNAKVYITIFIFFQYSNFLKYKFRKNRGGEEILFLF